MIFSGNTTALGATSIPMAEGYENYGVGLALVESARNDLSMFQALVQADYKEMSICKESTGVVQEGEVAALHEAVGGGIFKKIAELFRKLVAKIKAIFASFMARIRSLYMKDKDLVKKYQTQLSRKSDLGNLEVKWRKYEEDAVASAEDFSDVAKNFEGANGYDAEHGKRLNFYFKKVGYDVETVDEFVKEAIDDMLAEEDTVKLGSIGGWRAVAGFITGYDAKAKKMQAAIDKASKELEKLVKDYDKKVAEKADAAVKDDDASHANLRQTAVDNANKEYAMAQAYQTFALAAMQVSTKINTIIYKQNKAAFVKAVAATAGNKKIEESTLLNAIAEAAEDEVENVIVGALNKEELSDLSSAPTTVKDADVKDDPDALTYGPDCYTDSVPMDDAEGAVDTEINSKEESAYFGKLFW